MPCEGLNTPDDGRYRDHNRTTIAYTFAPPAEAVVVEIFLSQCRPRNGLSVRLVRCGEHARAGLLGAGHDPIEGGWVGVDEARLAAYCPA